MYSDGYHIHTYHTIEFTLGDVTDTTAEVVLLSLHLARTASGGGRYTKNMYIFNKFTGETTTRQQ